MANEVPYNRVTERLSLSIVELNNYFRCDILSYCVWSNAINVGPNRPNLSSINALMCGALWVGHRRWPLKLAQKQSEDIFEANVR